MAPLDRWVEIMLVVVVMKMLALVDCKWVVECMRRQWRSGPRLFRCRLMQGASCQVGEGWEVFSSCWVARGLVGFFLMFLM